MITFIEFLESRVKNEFITKHEIELQVILTTEIFFPRFFFFFSSVSVK